MKFNLKKTAQNLLLLVLSTVIILLVLEWISRLYFKQAYTHVIDENGAVVSMQRDAGHPENGLRPLFKGRLRSGEFDTEIILDSLGFRSPVQSGVELKKAPLHITLLGDSFMFGWGVELNASFAGFIAAELSRRIQRPVFVSNLAIPGTGQSSHLKLLKSIPQPTPHIVISGLYLIDYAASGNDLTDNLNDYFRDNSSRTLSNNRAEKVGLLRKMRRFLKQKSNLYRFFETQIGSIFLAKFSGAMNVQRDETTMNKAWHITDSLLVEINNFALIKDAVLVLQYIPNVFDVSRNNSGVYQKLERIAETNKIAIAPNPVEIFHQMNNHFDLNTYYYVVDGHWREEAHRVCAVAMANFIIENQLIR